MWNPGRSEAVGIAKRIAEFLIKEYAVRVYVEPKQSRALLTARFELISWPTSTLTCTAVSHSIGAIAIP